MKKWLLFMFAVISLNASEAVSTGTDIVARTINFLIFAGILWYLVGDKVKTFFENRKNEIATKFQEAERILEESKKEKEELEAKVKEAKLKAEEMIETAKKEANLVSEKILNSAKEEINIKRKHFEEYKENEIKKAKRRAVKEFLTSVFEDVHLSSEDAAKIVLKKVA